MKILEAILHTGGKTAEDLRHEMPELSDIDIQNLLNANQMMDGEKAILMPNPKNTEYWLAGLENNKLNKEVSYLLEQDPDFGCFVNQRAEFDKAYDSGNYVSDFIHIIDKDQAEIISEPFSTPDE